MKMQYKNQIGRFVIEMLVILALIAVFSPMIYTAQVEKRQKEINSNNAQQIMQVVGGAHSYLQKNMTDLSTVGDAQFSVGASTFKFDPLNDANPLRVEEISLNDKELINHLPPGLNDESRILTNRLFSNYRIGIRRQKSGDDVIVSAMVIAVPKDNVDYQTSLDISSMLGASGGTVEGNTILGNSGTWQANVVDFFDSVPEGAVAANVDFYVSKQAISSSGEAADDSGGDSDADVGYVHRDKSDTGAKETIGGKEYDGTTMQTDLEMGEGAGDVKRHGFKNIDAIFGGKKSEVETCDFGEDGCLQMKFDNDMGGMTEMGVTCGVNEPCISVNGALETEAYLIRPAGTSALDDVRIGKLAGVKLSELIPPMILLEVHRNKLGGSTINMIAKNCPTGYIPTATTVPVKWGVSGATVSTSNAAWPFYAMNFKNNYTDDATPVSVGLWGSGYNCADVQLSASNILAHYLEGDVVKMRSYIGNATEVVGGNRAIEANASFTVTSSSDTNFVDPNLTSPCTDGKLKINLSSVDRCGISNLSTAFACNKELLTIAQRDFNAGQGTAAGSLLRWEFYHPPEYMNQTYGGIDLYGTAIPHNTSVPVTFPDGSSKSIKQTKSWQLEGSANVEYDVYIYCKYVIQAFKNEE